MLWIQYINDVFKKNKSANKNQTIFTFYVSKTRIIYLLRFAIFGCFVFISTLLIQCGFIFNRKTDEKKLPPASKSFSTKIKSVFFFWFLNRNSAIWTKNKKKRYRKDCSKHWNKWRKIKRKLFSFYLFNFW